MKNLAIIGLIGTWITLTCWGLVQGILGSQSIVATISIVVVWISFLILLVSALIERFKEAKSDPYKDVEV
tara:strand:+ start:282 stop:491 length:210 start_codon:yes stop_codon:yes gene_type:complete